MDPSPISTAPIPHTKSEPLAWLNKAQWFWTLLAVVNLWKDFSSWKLGLIFDECYYWIWSLPPQICYFDHHPLTAWLIASGHFLFGHTPFAVRFWALVSGVLLALIGRLLAREMFGEPVGNRAGIFLLLAPIFAGNALLMTPDTFLIPMWASAVYFSWKGSRDNAGIGWWLATGAAAGIGMLSKYTMVLFYVALGILWLLSPGKREHLLLGIATAAFVSLLFFLPVIWWNSQHDWVSFQHQINHGFRNEHHALINFQNLTDYSTFLVVLVSPLLGLFCFRSAAMRLREEHFLYLALFYWTVILFFAFSAAKAHIEANWPMPAFVTGLIMVAADWDSYSLFWKRAALTLLLVADIGAVLGVSYLLLPKDSPLAISHLSLNTSCIQGFPGADKLASSAQQGFRDFQGRMEEFLGPQEVAKAVASEFRKSGADFLCLSSYQFAGVMAFYAPELEPMIWLPYLGRYRFPWINDRLWAGKNALAAEWPHSGPDYRGLFVEFTPPQEFHVPGIKRPLFLSFGRNYDPEKINYRPGK